MYFCTVSHNISTIVSCLEMVVAKGFTIVAVNGFTNWGFSQAICILPKDVSTMKCLSRVSLVVR
jgi:hypothetical protein